MWTGPRSTSRRAAHSIGTDPLYRCTPRSTPQVDRTKEYIQAGDVFQLVLSQRFERRTFADPFEIYRSLRVVNPSPYMAYLQARPLRLLCMLCARCARCACPQCALLCGAALPCMARLQACCARCAAAGCFRMPWFLLAAVPCRLAIPLMRGCLHEVRGCPQPACPLPCGHWCAGPRLHHCGQQPRDPVPRGRGRQGDQPVSLAATPCCCSVCHAMALPCRAVMESGMRSCNAARIWCCSAAYCCHERGNPAPAPAPCRPPPRPPCVPPTPPRPALRRPLAGTRRRGATPEADQALEAELLADEKECAEHVMLVDLGRNDVGKVRLGSLALCVQDLWQARRRAS